MNSAFANTMAFVTLKCMFLCYYLTPHLMTWYIIASLYAFKEFDHQMIDLNNEKDIRTYS